MTAQNKTETTKVSESSPKQDKKTTEPQEEEKIAQVAQGRQQVKTGSYFSRVFFNWAWTFIQATNEQEKIHSEQYGNLPEDDKVENCIRTLEANWEKMGDQKESKHALAWTIWMSFKWIYISAIGFAVIQFIMGSAQPILIGQIIEFVQNKDQEIQWGIFLVFFTISLDFLNVMACEQMHFLMNTASHNTQNSLVSLIFKKNLRTSASTNTLFDQGQIINLTTEDAGRLRWITYSASEVIVLPAKLVYCVFTLYYMTGYYFLYAVFVFYLTKKVCEYYKEYNSKMEKELSEIRDEKSKVTTETINNIKLLKLYSWTNLFMNKIQKYVDQELDKQWQQHCWNQLQHLVNILSSKISVMIVLASYIGAGNFMTLSQSIMIIRILEDINHPLRALPNFMFELSKTQISLERIQKFLNSDEINPSCLKAQTKPEDHAGELNSIEIKQGNFSWGVKCPGEGIDEEDTKKKMEKEDKLDFTLEQKVNLKDINLEVEKGEFVFVLGETGSGKSSLLNAILGEMVYVDQKLIENFGGLDKKHPAEKLKTLKNEIFAQEIEEAPIKINGTVSFAQQVPWVQSMTIRDNILFGLPMDEERYVKTIESCELESDLEIFPAGDLSQIGEKGINLSGGQKARISLARAVYHNADIILMDDVISALDAHVKRSIFDNVICGMLEDKTRILVTHSIDLIHPLDTVMLMKEGRVIARDTYENLKDHPLMKEVIQVNNKNSKVAEDNENEHLVRYKSSKKTKSIKEVESQFGKQAKAQHIKEKLAKFSVKKETDENIKAGKLLDNEEDEKMEFKFNDYMSIFEGNRIYQMIALGCVLGFQQSYRLYQYNINELMSTEENQRDRYYEFLQRILFFALLDACFHMIKNFTFQSFINSQYQKVHHALLKSVLESPINLFFDITPSGKLISRFTEDVGVYKGGLQHCINGCIDMSFWIMGILCMIFYQSKMSILFVPLFYYLVRDIFAKAKQAFFKNGLTIRATDGPKHSHFSETNNGLSTIRAFNLQQNFITKFMELQDRNSICHYAAHGCWVYFKIRIEFLVDIFLVIVISYIVTQRGQVSELILGMMIQQTFHIAPCLAHSLGLLNHVNTIMIKHIRVQRLCELKSEIRQTEEQKKLFEKVGESWPSKGEIHYQDVKLKYRPNTEIVLNELSYKIQSGHKVGIVGRTGAGKSTIALSLTRIVETCAGKIFIDGVDIKDVDIDYLREKITIIPQDSTMFNESLRFNIDPFGKCSDDEIISLLKRAGLQKLLEREGGETQKQQLDMKLSEGGTNLSSGEKQLICICRAVLRKNKIVLLDEATANIDLVTEEKIQKLIAEEFKDCTVITIAHRLQTIMNSDRILYLSFGKCLEYDSPANLLQIPNGNFAKLVQDMKKRSK